MTYKFSQTKVDLNVPYCMKNNSIFCLPEKEGQFIFIDNCYLPLIEVLEILRKNFTFKKFLLIRCLVNRKVCIRVIFFSCKDISRECKTFYESKSHPETRNMTSILQGPIKPKYHNLAKYRFLKAFCDSYIGMTSENLLCSSCCAEDVRITINEYFCWRFYNKKMILEANKEKDDLFAQMSLIDRIKAHLQKGEGYLEWGTHQFDIEDLHLQTDIVDDFFKEMRFPKKVYYDLPDGRKLFLGITK